MKWNRICNPSCTNFAPRNIRANTPNGIIRVFQEQNFITNQIFYLKIKKNENVKVFIIRSTFDVPCFM